MRPSAIAWRSGSGALAGGIRCGVARVAPAPSAAYDRPDDRTDDEDYHRIVDVLEVFARVLPFVAERFSDGAALALACAFALVAMGCFVAIRRPA